MLSTNCLITNDVPTEPGCCLRLTSGAVLCRRAKKETTYFQCSPTVSALTTDGNNLEKEKAPPMWEGNYRFYKVKKSLFKNHPIIHWKVSLPFHKYITYWENIVMILQAGRLAMWFKWPYRHVRDKSSIAVTAVCPGQKPSSKNGERKLLSHCEYDSCHMLMYSDWHSLLFIFIRLPRHTVTHKTDKYKIFFTILTLTSCE